jgi:pimeloyl-ACP methyl ester carboxylesterase
MLRRFVIPTMSPFIARKSHPSSPDARGEGDAANSCGKELACKRPAPRFASMCSLRYLVRTSLVLSLPLANACAPAERGKLAPTNRNAGAGSSRAVAGALIANKADQPGGQGPIPAPRETLAALAAHSMNPGFPVADEPKPASWAVTAEVASPDSSADAGRRTPRNPWFCSLPSAPIGLDLGPGEYSARNAYWMAWLSLQGYISYFAGPLLSSAGFTDFRIHADHMTGLLGFVASTPEFTVASFSGSVDLRDWLLDLTFSQMLDENWGIPGRQHKGFYTAIQGAWPSLEGEILRQSAGGKPVFVVGHSLGGAMAFHAAVRLARGGKDVQGVYAFAAPRVGDADFAQYYDSLLRDRTWRFENNEDLVPHLAPAAEGASDFGRLLPWPLGDLAGHILSEMRYTHVGKLLRFDESGALSGPFVEEASNEARFWQKIHARSEGQNPLQRIIANWRIAGDHWPTPNFCYLDSSN